MADLKSCPFCGSTDIDPEEVLAADPDGTRYTYPGCGNCGASCRRWNDRVESTEGEVKDALINRIVNVVNTRDSGEGCGSFAAHEKVATIRKILDSASGRQE